MEETLYKIENMWMVVTCSYLFRKNSIVKAYVRIWLRKMP